jgi:hypothetical protein
MPSTPTIKGTVSDGTPTNHEIQQQSIGHVTKNMRVLDMNVVEQIMEELRSVDADSNEL